jgi:hypothetical protein
VDPAGTLPAQARRTLLKHVLTPDFRGDPDDTVEGFLNKAICG